MRRAAKIDANQPEIVDALRRAGATVQPIHTVGSGVPDLLVGYRGVNLLMEVKDGDKPESAQKLTPDEAEWHQNWLGQRSIVRSVFEALGVLKRISSDAMWCPRDSESKSSSNDATRK